MTSLSSLNNRTYKKETMAHVAELISRHDLAALEADKDLKKYEEFECKAGIFYNNGRRLIAQEDCQACILAAYLEQSSGTYHPARTALGIYMKKHYIGVSKRFIDVFYDSLKDEPLKEQLKKVEEVEMAAYEEKDKKDKTRQLQVGKVVRLIGSDTQYKITRRVYVKDWMYSLVNAATSQPIRGRRFYSYELNY